MIKKLVLVLVAVIFVLSGLPLWAEGAGCAIGKGAGICAANPEGKSIESAKCCETCADCCSAQCECCKDKCACTKEKCICCAGKCSCPAEKCTCRCCSELKKEGAE